jgi:hypothetical protein
MSDQGSSCTRTFDEIGWAQWPQSRSVAFSWPYDMLYGQRRVTNFVGSGISDQATRILVAALGRMGLKPSLHPSYQYFCMGVGRYCWKVIHLESNPRNRTPSHQSFVSRLLDGKSLWDCGNLYYTSNSTTREWGYLSKHVFKYGVFYPHDLPSDYQVDSLIPSCVLFIPAYVHTLPQQVGAFYNYLQAREVAQSAGWWSALVVSVPLTTSTLPPWNPLLQV